MSRVRLKLDGHCVGTTARHEMRHIESRVLSDRQRPDDAERHETLRRFLEATDVVALRVARPELEGIPPVEVEIRETGGSWSVEIIGRDERPGPEDP